MVLWMSEFPSWADPVKGLRTEVAWWFPLSAFPGGVPQESPAWPPCPCLELLDRQHTVQSERVVDWNSIFQRESDTEGSSCVKNLTKAEVLPKYKRIAKASDCLNLSVELGQNQNSLNFSTVPKPSVMTTISTCHFHPPQSYKQV